MGTSSHELMHAQTLIKAGFLNRKKRHTLPHKLILLPYKKMDIVYIFEREKLRESDV